MCIFVTSSFFRHVEINSIYVTHHPSLFQAQKYNLIYISIYSI